MKALPLPHMKVKYFTTQCLDINYKCDFKARKIKITIIINAKDAE
jgi:hypothetical protein